LLGLGVEAGEIFLLDEEQGEVVLARHRGLAQEAFQEIPRFKLGQGFPGRVALSGEVLATADLSQDPRFLRKQVIEAGFNTLAAIPLKAAGKVIGILEVAIRAPHSFPNGDFPFFTTIGATIGMAVANARMYEMSLRRGEALAALTHSTVTLAESGPEPEAILVMLEGVNRATRASRSAWLAYDEAAGRLHVGTSVGFSPEVLHQAEHALTMSLTDPWMPARAAVEGRSVYLKQTGGSPFWPVFDPDVRSANCAPLTYRGRLYGVLVLLSEEEDGFGSEALSLADTFALYTGAALANGTLYREIQQVARQAEEASRHKSEFLANMSHELRTPLNAILGFSGLLRDETCGPLSAKQDRYVGHIHGSGKHLLALINDLLDLSKVEAGKIELHPETFALYEALAAALTEIGVQAEEKGLQIELHVDESLSTITADPTRFKQIVYNLLSNAVKFTPEVGTVTVTAKVVPRSEYQVPSLEPGTQNLELGTPKSPDFVEISVTDTGIGIKAEDLPKLFQAFTQLESSITKGHQGTGLGLALTKQLVELHGGTILAASEGLDRGSTFTVRFPTPPEHV
jgi:signal transduction histidine kinase